MFYPDYQRVGTPEARQRFEKLWRTELDPDPGLTVVEIMHAAKKRQIRGMYPWPGCRVRLTDASGAEMARITLVRSRAVAGSLEPGQIADDGAVGAGSGRVQIVELQPEGKRPMTLEAFRNGHPWNAGMRLESIT